MTNHINGNPYTKFICLSKDSEALISKMTDAELDFMAHLIAIDMNVAQMKIMEETLEKNHTHDERFGSAPV